MTVSDLHVHTRFSADAAGEPAAFVERAVELGLKAIGLTEHWDFDPDDRGYGSYDYRANKDEVRRLRSLYGPEIEILLGVEVSYSSAREEEIRDALSGKGFDYVIGAVHAVDGVYLSEPRCRRDLATVPPREIYGHFFEETERAVESGLFDVIGHLDLCKRFGVEFYGPFNPGQPGRGLVKRVLKKAVSAGLALEVNASGTWQGPGEPYPGLPVLRMYKNTGGELLTVGSDAHAPEGVGEVAHALRSIRLAGLPGPVIFKRREPVVK